MVAYRGTTNSLLSFGSAFGSGVFCLDAVEYLSPLTSSQNTILANFIFYISLSNSNIYEMNISSSLTYNFSSSLYDLQNASCSYRLIYSSASTISSLFINSAYLIMQSDLTLAITVYSLNYSTISTLSGLPLKKVYSFFNYTSSGGGSNM